MEVIAVVSKKSKSGKTTVIEHLVKEMASRDLRAGTIKHIPRDDFTIDTEGTDTWRHVRSGSVVTAAISKNEVTYILPQEREVPLEDVLFEVSALELPDYVLVEGFKKKDIPRIVTASSYQEALDMVDGNTIAVSGIVAGETDSIHGIDVPIIDATTNASAIIDLLETPEKKVERILDQLPGLDCGDCGKESCRDLADAIVDGKDDISSCVVLSAGEAVNVTISGKEVPMGDFVQGFVRNTVLGMVRSLKGGDAAPGDSISIRINLREEDL
jgi:molybdopterin-guanine dinucleotide biosynthesis protein B